MKRLPFFAVFTLIVACSPTPTAIPLTSTVPSPVSAGNSVTVSITPQVVTSVVPSQPASTLIGTPTSPASLWLQMISPQDEAVVSTTQVDVIGSAPAGTVINVNDDILIVGTDQRFKSTVTLDEGPNVIEVVASDDNGNETSVILTITYEP